MTTIKTAAIMMPVHVFPSSLVSLGTARPGSAAVSCDDPWPLPVESVDKAV